MELIVTCMFEDIDLMPTLCGSCAELGPDAGRITWENSKAYSKRHPLLLSRAEIELAREYFSDYGAWTDEQLAALSDEDIQALATQEVAAQIRDFEEAGNWEAYHQQIEAGRIQGGLFRFGGQVYFNMSH